MPNLFYSSSLYNQQIEVVENLLYGVPVNNEETKEYTSMVGFYIANYVVLLGAMALVICLGIVIFG